MPTYAQFATTTIPWDVIPKRIGVMAMLGVPYGDAINNSVAMAKAQAASIATDIQASGGPQNLDDKEIVAVIAYIQRLGRDATLPAVTTGLRQP